MLTLLFIEDDKDAVEPIVNLIKREKKDAMCCHIVSFGEAKDKITMFSPDIVILDLLAGGGSAEPVPAGLITRDYIWEKHFCPIVIYSAEPQIHDDNYTKHPFIMSIKKGKDSVRELLSAFEELGPQVKAIREAARYIRYSFSCAMREVAPYAFAAFTDVGKRNETIMRSGRRRLAALMDQPLKEGTMLASWEQYLFPPVCPDTLLGDILRKADGDINDPSSFRIILSPSCDLVASGDRKPKIDNVLVARCCSMKEGLDRAGLTGMKPAKMKERLPKTILSHGYHEGLIPFPGLKDLIPLMMADLNDMEQIPFGDIGGSNPAYLRIASIDSPFRELVSWAHTQIVGRPGLPDRDLNRWVDDIMTSLTIEQ